MRRFARNDGFRPADKRQRTKAQKRLEAQTLLIQCRDEALAALTPEKLQSCYGLHSDEASTMLASERARREARHA